MANPDTQIRIGYISALQTATGLKVWHKRIPKTVTPIPSRYILVDSQTKNQTTVSKPDGLGNSQTYFEWLCTLDVNIYNVNASGYSDASVIESIEDIVINTIRKGVVNIPGFYNKDTNIIESQDLSVETQTQSIDRKVIKFEHWLCEK